MALILEKQRRLEAKPALHNPGAHILCEQLGSNRTLLTLAGLHSWLFNSEGFKQFAMTLNCFFY